MAFSQYAQKLFSLDTLDTRFTNSSSAPPKADISIDPTKPSLKGYGNGDLRKSKSGQTVQKEGPAASRWGTPEFFIYYVVFIICVPLMFKAAHDVSTRTALHYSLRWATY